MKIIRFFLVIVANLCLGGCATGPSTVSAGNTDAGRISVRNVDFSQAAAG